MYQNLIRLSFCFFFVVVGFGSVLLIYSMHIKMSGCVWCFVCVFVEK